MEVKFVFIFVLFLFLFINMCINVSPFPTLMRSEPLVKQFQMQIMDILTIIILSFCSIVFIFSKIDLNTRYIPFNVRLNTLMASKKAKWSRNLYLYLLLILYVMTCECFLVVLLPDELCKIHPNIRGITQKNFSPDKDIS